MYPVAHDDCPDTAWPLAVRTATATSLLGAAAAGALHRFVGVDAGTLLVVASLTAVGVGSRLPAARPAWLHRPA